MTNQPRTEQTAEGSEGALFDRRGIPIHKGDVLKVFHFVGARRKRHYMYKQCMGTETLGRSDALYFRFSHLNFVEDPRLSNGPYPERADGRRLTNYEIVQSIDCDHEDRPSTPDASPASGMKP